MFYYYNLQGNFEPPAAKALSAVREKRLAQAYVPEQLFRNILPAPEALRAGTVFSELSMQYGGRKHGR